MFLVLLLLLPVTCTAAWAFFYRPPRNVNRRSTWRFNAASLSIGLVLAGGWAVRTYLVMSATADAAWWPIISIVGVMVILSSILALATLLRNLVVFRGAGSRGR